jgi:hypothetical protein
MGSLKRSVEIRELSPSQEVPEVVQPKVSEPMVESTVGKQLNKSLGLTHSNAEPLEIVRIIEEILARRELGEIGQERDYLLALQELRGAVENSVGKAILQIGWYQTVFGEGGVALAEVFLQKSDRGALRLINGDGQPLELTASWQVLLGAWELTDPEGRCVLFFPWSRLAKGAPVVARELVDRRGSGALAEYVRCERPALLGPTGGARYQVRQKMLVRPLEVG